MNAALDVLGVSRPCSVYIELDNEQNRRYVDEAAAAPNAAASAAAADDGGGGGGGKASAPVSAVAITTTTTTTSTSTSLASRLPLYSPTETVSGVVHVHVKEARVLHHRGLRLEFLAVIDSSLGKNSRQELLSLVRDLEEAPDEVGPGEVRRYAFCFTDVDKPYDTYRGINVRLRYLLRVTVERPQLYQNIVSELDIAVQHSYPAPEINNSIRMEVGIEDVLHIEFEYNKSKFHLRDVVIGKIFFLLVRIKIKRMEIEIRKRENVSVGAGPAATVHSEVDTIAKYEVMDGAPVRGESIPVRMFLSPYALTPTYRNVCGTFSVKYYLNLVLVDEEDRRYWKQHEVFLWRE